MKRDKERIETDKILENIEAEIAEYYQDRIEDVSEEWLDYMQDVAEATAKEQRDYEDAKKSGDMKKIVASLLALQMIRNKHLITDKKAKVIKENTLRKLAVVNQGALDIVKKHKPKIYEINYNQVASGVKKIGVEFQKLNFKLSKKFADKKIKDKKINATKDMRWNMKFIDSQIRQGMNNGESIPKIANRIFPEMMAKSDTKGLSKEELDGLIKRNRQAAIRTARTKVTEIENQARLDSYHELQRLGVDIKKRWIATGDSRTRDWHLSMDGQTVGIDEKFTDGLGEKLDKPAQDGASPRTTYNCRCSMEAVINGFKRDKTRHSAEIQAEKDRRIEKRLQITERKLKRKLKDV